jgi:anion-transporting  ArsA/GET3 family ATPase
MNEADARVWADGQLVLPPDRRIELVVGPGGVGKTTIAAALALAGAASGRRTVVVTIDPSRRLAQALGLGDDTTTPSARRVVHEGAALDVIVLDTAKVFEQIVRENAATPQAATEILDNPIYRATVRHLGGALEYAACAQVQMLAATGAHDLIVLDTPPTANAIEFLDAPARIAELANNPAARFLTQSKGGLGMRFLGLGSAVMLKALEAIGGGAFMSELGRFLAAFGQVVAEFGRRAGALSELFASQGTGVVLVTSPSELSTREAADFLGVLEERGLRVDGVVLNRVDPPVGAWPGDEAVARVVGDVAAVARVQAEVAALAVQSASADRAATWLRRARPSLAVCSLGRIDPPPVSLAELLAVGTRVARW